MVIAQSRKNHISKAGHQLVEGIEWVKEVEQYESEAVRRRGQFSLWEEARLSKAVWQSPRI